LSPHLFLPKIRLLICKSFQLRRFGYLRRKGAHLHPVRTLSLGTELHMHAAYPSTDHHGLITTHLFAQVSLHSTHPPPHHQRTEKGKKKKAQ
jgi:hypothetical protein